MLCWSTGHDPTQAEKGLAKQKSEVTLSCNSVELPDLNFFILHKDWPGNHSMAAFSHHPSAHQHPTGVAPFREAAGLNVFLGVLS